MDQNVVVDSLRIAAAAYLLVVAVGAVFGFHRPLIAYPLRVGYSAFSLGVEFLTRGRVHMARPVRKARRRGGMQLRNVGARFSEWRSERAESRGEISEPKMTWTSARDDVPAAPAPSVPRPDVAPAASQPLCPVHGVPLATPLLFDEQTGARYPEGTTHAVCLQAVPTTPPPVATPPAPAPPRPEPAAAPGAETGRGAGVKPPASSPWDDEDWQPEPPKFR